MYLDLFLFCDEFFLFSLNINQKMFHYVFCEHEF
jgi:hypothetical protein